MLHTILCKKLALMRYGAEIMATSSTEETKMDKIYKQHALHALGNSRGPVLLYNSCLIRIANIVENFED